MALRSKLWPLFGISPRADSLAHPSLERGRRAQRRFDHPGADREATTRLATTKMWRWSPLGGINVLTGARTYAPRPAMTRIRAAQR